MVLRTVQDHMRAKVTLTSIKFAKFLCKYVKLAKGRYDDYREKTKLEKRTYKDLKKIIHGEIEDIRRNK